VQKIRIGSIVLCILLFAAITVSAEEIDSREALVQSRALPYPEAVRIMERALPSSGDLSPWLLLELSERAAVAGEWAKSLDWGRKQNLSALPSPIADRVHYRLAEALIRTGDRDHALSLLRARAETGRAKDPLVWLLWFREVGAEELNAGTVSSGVASTVAGKKRAPGSVESMAALLDAANPNLKTDDPSSYGLSLYLSALAAVHSGEWAFAARSLARFTPRFDASFPDYAPWASFYLGWSNYRLGRNADAIRELSRYLDTWKGHERGWQAATACALASMKGGGDSFSFAERAARLAPSKAELAESLMFEASILTDRNLLDRAESTLLGVADGSATSGLTPSASRAAYALGNLAFRQGKRDLAETRWLSLSDRFPNDPLTGDALYRAAEQRFIALEWARAGELFSRYRREWPAGSFIDSALALGGEAYARSGNRALAILWWEELLKKFPSGTAAPRAWGYLAAAYRAEGDYSSALRAAESYQKKFPAEARLDGMGDEIEILRRLVAGESPDAASLVSVWEREGKASTVAGRAAGLALARWYLADYARRGDAKKILSSIVALAPATPDRLGSPDRGIFAATLALYGNVLREEGSHRDAARTLLKAGAYFSSLDGERSAEALYGASDSFIQVRLDGDAAKTVETLKKTWPESAWTRRAELLLQSAGRE
jgi:TolA-binding protein